MGIIPGIRDYLKSGHDCKIVAFRSSAQINMQSGNAISKELKTRGQASSGLIAARKQKLQISIVSAVFRRVPVILSSWAMQRVSEHPFGAVCLWC